MLGFAKGAKFRWRHAILGKSDFTNLALGCRRISARPVSQLGATWTHSEIDTRVGGLFADFSELTRHQLGADTTQIFAERPMTFAVGTSSSTLTVASHVAALIPTAGSENGNDAALNVSTAINLNATVGELGLRGQMHLSEGGAPPSALSGGAAVAACL